MLADLVDHVIGIDPAKTVFAAVIVDSGTRGELVHREFKTTPSGYRQAIEWADDCGATADSRVWAIEGAGSYGSGLAQVLGRDGEWVIEFGHPKSQAASDGTKTDRLDAARAARESLGRTTWAQPRARGAREAMRALLVARDGAQKSRTRAINELKNLVVTAPVEFRDSLAGLKTTDLVNKCGRFRIDADTGDELAGTKTAMRSVARRIRTLTSEAAELEQTLQPLVTEFAPQLLDELGVGTICAAQIIVAWSHQGRFATDAAFCRLAGVSPIEATTGGTNPTRHRLNTGGDRNLNKALHTIALVRISRDPQTQQFIARKRAEGKTARDTRRILKRYIARRLFRLLENPPN